MQKSKNARLPSLLFLTGLCVATGAATYLDTVGQNWLKAGTKFSEEQAENALKPLPPRALTDFDIAAATIAWRYFELNTRPETGLVDSVAGFPSTTLWDQGSYLFAIVAAAKLGIIPMDTAEERAAGVLNALSELELFEERLPNKAYNTISLAKTDYANQADEKGIGWSALDMARLLCALRILRDHFPQLSKQAQQAVSGWDLVAFATEGELWGANIINDKTEILQEGRIGYEQYGARAAALWGLDVSNAMSATRFTSWRDINGIQIPMDTRIARSFHAITPVLSEPFLLQAFEIGLDQNSAILASHIYQAQEKRFRDEGLPTMVSEDHLDRGPMFAYSSVFSNGRDWAVVDESGHDWDDLRTLSAKATLGWHALYETEYTQMMAEMITDLGDPDKGWHAGKYEESQEANLSLSANTNAVILEAIHYKAFGPFLHTSKADPLVLPTTNSVLFAGQK